jgi:hypothetical protein
MEAEPKRKRRWFQFSLRSLLNFVLICAIPCAWLGAMIERKREEREIVNQIRELGVALNTTSTLRRRPMAASKTSSSRKRGK